MSSNLELIGALASVALPASPDDFALETEDDLRHAYREHAKHNDVRLIFAHPTHEFSHAGQEALISACQGPVLTRQMPDSAVDTTGGGCWDEDFLDFCDHTPEAALDHFVDADRYWERLQRRLDEFVATPWGRIVADSLSRQLGDFMLSNMFFEGSIPNDLYERIVAAELCWRQQIKANHQARFPELYEPLFEVDVVKAVSYADNIAEEDLDFTDWTASTIDADEPTTDIWSEVPEAFDRAVIAAEKERLRVPISYTFEQFKQLLTTHTVVRDAGITDIWYIENNAQPHSSDKRFEAISEACYPNLRKLLFKWPSNKPKRVLWHHAQGDEARGTGKEWLDRLVLQRGVDEEMKNRLEMEFDEAEQRVAAARERGRNLQVLPMRIKPVLAMDTPQHSPLYRDPRS